MRKGRLTKEEQIKRIKQLLEFVFTFRYATRCELNKYAQDIMKIRYPQRLIGYTLKRGFIYKYREPKIVTKIYFLADKAVNLLFDEKDNVEHYTFEKGKIGQSDHTEHSLLVRAFFILNQYLKVKLEDYCLKWLLRRTSEEKDRQVPAALVIIARFKKIAIEAMLQHNHLPGLKRIVDYYKHEIEVKSAYQMVLILTDNNREYEYLRRELFLIEPDFCARVFILAEISMFELGGSCFYQSKIMPIEKALSLPGGLKDESIKTGV